MKCRVTIKTSILETTVYVVDDCANRDDAFKRAMRAFKFGGNNVDLVTEVVVTEM